MKLEKITIDNTEYYQFVIISTSYPYIDTVLDLFEDSREIPEQRAKAQLILNQINK